MLVDERILGSGDFVARIMREADERLQRQLACHTHRRDTKETIDQLCSLPPLPPPSRYQPLEGMEATKKLLDRCNLIGYTVNHDKVFLS